MLKLDFALLPLDPRTGEPLPPRAQPGYYPDQHALDQQAFWDAATRELVLARVNNVPQIRFLKPDEASLYAAVFARLLPQPDRDEAHQIPILEVVDARLWEGKGDGYRFAEMPPDPDAYQLGAKGIAAAAQAQHRSRFEALTATEQDELLAVLHAGKPLPGDTDCWRRLPPGRFFQLLMADAASAYYAHPYAWDEIGFGGPAYPRGYMRLERGEREPWEAEEKRYAWAAPASARSDVFENQTDPSSRSSNPGQGGTH